MLNLLVQIWTATNISKNKKINEPFIKGLSYLNKDTIMKVRFSLITSLILLFAGCSDSTTGIDGLFKDINKNKDSEITFTFSSPDLEIGSYALSAADELNQINIYIFAENNNGEKVLERFYNNLALSTASSGKKTIQISIPAYAGGKDFYFVGNGDYVDGLNSVSIGMSLEAFKNITTSSGDLSFYNPVKTGYAEDVTMTSGINVTIKRRVARFDIQNDPDDTNFIIEKIIVRNAKEKGSIFDSSIDIATLDELTLDLTSSTIGNSGLSENVFYLYAAATTSNISISLTGKTKEGASVVYGVTNLPTSITPNTCYTLRIEDKKKVQP